MSMTPERVSHVSAACQPLYVFLDQNHWIYLAKALRGQPRLAAHANASQYLLSAVQDGKVRLPIFQIHVMEHYNANDATRRARLSAAFDRLSGGWYAANWSDILPAEIEIAVATTFGAANAPAMPNVFGQGFTFALNPPDAYAWPAHWSPEERAGLERFARQPGALHHFLTLPHESGRLKSKEGIAEAGRNNARAAEDLRVKRRPYSEDMWRRAQHTGYVIDLQAQLEQNLLPIGRTFEDFLKLGTNGLARFWRRVPTMHVDCELTLYRDRQWSRAIKANDVYDIAQLVVAIPYCDVVVVEKFWGRAIEETGLAREFRTAVCSDIAEVPSIVEAQLRTERLEGTGEVGDAGQ